MIDRKQIHYSEQLDRNLAAGATVQNEGMILCEMVQNGGAVVFVQPVVTGTEQLAGVSLLPYQLPTNMTLEQQFVIPSSGSLIFQLRFGNVVSLSELAMIVGGGYLTIDETAFSATPPTGTVKVNLLTGQLKFAAGNAGATVNFICRVNLTVAQSSMLFQSRSINNAGLVPMYAQVGILKGYVEVSTDQFDSSMDFSTESSVNPLRLGNNGQVTLGGAGPVLPQGKVLAVPDLSGTLQGPMLRFSMLVG